MAEKTKYGLWLKFRVGKSLSTEDGTLTASLVGRTVTIESEDRGKPLSKTSWLVMSCGGFETEDQAREFGGYCQVEQNLPVLRKDSAGAETENQ